MLWKIFEIGTTAIGFMWLGGHSNFLGAGYRCDGG